MDGREGTAKNARPPCGRQPTAESTVGSLPRPASREAGASLDHRVPPRYMVGTLELLVAENYLLVHLSGGTSRAQVPALAWMRQCYHALDRR